MPNPSLQTLRDDHVMVIVRAARIPDMRRLVDALVDGGIRVIELTFTTPDVLDYLESVRDGDHGGVVGVGTVRTSQQATAAIDTGAEFLVTPGIRHEVCDVATARAIPTIVGAMTPTEIMTAHDLGLTFRTSDE